MLPHLVNGAVKNVEVRDVNEWHSARQSNFSLCGRTRLSDLFSFLEAEVSRFGATQIVSCPPPVLLTSGCGPDHFTIKSAYVSPIFFGGR
jgi:hypothetical protein